MAAELYERVAAVYLPMVLAACGALLHREQSRRFVACLLGLLWTMPSLLILQRINELSGWWHFQGGDLLFRGIPLELYVGWIILWGLVPPLLFTRQPLWLVTLIMIAVDCIAMPLCRATVVLSSRWLWGELVAVLLVLCPALCLARWTSEDSHLRARVWLQIVASGMLIFLFFPEVAFALRPGLGWQPLLGRSGLEKQLWIQMVLLLGVPGVSAAIEFCERGKGTPIPYDPPQRLVTSGMYRYCANPMQASCALVMVAWACLLRNGWLLLGAGISIIYSAGLAEWDEAQDLKGRFGSDWERYRAAVRAWLPSWRPYHAGSSAKVYIARGCHPCQEIRIWIEKRNPLDLEIVDAEVFPHGPIRRMSYDPGDGSGIVDGVRAMGRVLEHIHLGWALAGCLLRLPGIWQIVQLLLDASGLGPREIQQNLSCEPRRS